VLTPRGLGFIRSGYGGKELVRVTYPLFKSGLISGLAANGNYLFAVDRLGGGPKGGMRRWFAWFSEAFGEKPAGKVRFCLSESRSCGSRK